MLIYKIFRAVEWRGLEQEGSTAGAPIDLGDGFIHFSTADQAVETAAKHFGGGDDLWLAAIGTDALGADILYKGGFPNMRPGAIA